MTRRNQAGFSLLSTPRGCSYSSGHCTNTGFIYYFYDNRPGSQQGWGAMSTSPAGRLKKWYWTGSVWAS
jgi:hypothetical protein